MGPAGGAGQGISTPVSMGTTGFVPSHGEHNLMICLISFSYKLPDSLKVTSYIRLLETNSTN